MVNNKLQIITRVAHDHYA